MNSESENSLFGILLAAGASRRMGDQNKLLCKIGDESLIERSLSALSAVCTVTIVTGWQSAAVEEAVSMAKNRVRFVHNKNHQDGMSSSIKAGLKAIPASATGCFISPADMPNISIDALLAMRDMHQNYTDSIIVPYAGERQGNPVLWPHRFFDILKTLEGDRGAKALLEGQLSAHIQPVQVSGTELLDIDTVQDLREFTS